MQQTPFGNILKEKWHLLKRKDKMNKQSNNKMASSKIIIRKILMFMREFLKNRENKKK